MTTFAALFALVQIVIAVSGFAVAVVLARKLKKSKWPTTPLIL